MLFSRAKPLAGIECFGISNLGHKRSNNEDNLVLNHQFMDSHTVSQSANGENVRLSCEPLSPDCATILAVCDGMGGESLGEVAALTAAEQLARLDGQPGELEQLIDEAVTRINTLIQEKAEERGCLRIGSTLALAYIENGMLHVLNIGDSRVYFLRNNKLTQLTRDHTEMQYLIEARIITRSEARIHPGRHVITQHLGMDDDQLCPYKAKPIRLEPGDRILVCSDGVTEMLEDKSIAQLLGDAQSPEDAAESIVECALANGGVDNTTVITVIIK